jgi:hypothetical protein
MTERHNRTESGAMSAGGRDGIVGDHDSDPDRRDLRSEIGKYVSLASFPTTARELTDAVAATGAPDTVINTLRGIDPDTSLANTRELWLALDLESDERF